MRADETLVIVPTRGRPHAIKPMIDAWLDTDATAALVFVLDEDDPTLRSYWRAVDALGSTRAFFQVAPRRRLVGSLNATATAFCDQYRALGFMGDDHRPRTEGWDRRFAEVLSEGSGVVYGNDLLRRQDTPTAAVMTSDIIKALGYMGPPTLVHLYVDVVWADWGRGMGALTYLDDVIIEHMHPAAGKAPEDAGYAEANSPERYHSDRVAYEEYCRTQLPHDIAKLKELR